jgi:hypothetical protein
MFYYIQLHLLDQYNSYREHCSDVVDIIWFSFHIPNLTFRGPCIVIYSYNKTNEMHSFLKFVFGIELYMFRAGFLSIIRSLVLYTQQ